MSREIFINFGVCVYWLAIGRKLKMTLLTEEEQHLLSLYKKADEETRIEKVSHVGTLF